MQIAVIGYGKEGRAAVDYWRPRGDITVCARELTGAGPDDVEVRTGATYADVLEQFDLLVRSPGVHPRVLPDGVATTSVTQEFLDQCPIPVIGVTGTYGKGTTCTAITRILEAAGQRVLLAGNIGTPPLPYLDQIHAYDVAVLELSTQQLIDLRSSPAIAVVLDVQPDHLDWHDTVEDYYHSKESIAEHQLPGDTVIFNPQHRVSSTIAATSPGTRLPLGTEETVAVTEDGMTVRGELLLCSEDIPLRGRHNHHNIAAATTACLVHLGDGADLDDVRRGIRALEPLPHRLCPVAVINNVTYVNDSLSTLPETTIAAMAAYPESKIIILGGSDKGLDLASLARAVRSADVRRALLIGQTAPRIAEALRTAGHTAFEEIPAGLEVAVERAATLAEPGDVVLLSPACASFDQFADYADRGDTFTAAALRLDHPGA